MTKGRLFVVSAPSGGGKSTLCRSIIKTVPKIQYSISATTREPRLGEVHGKDYFFLKEKEFLSWIDEGRFLEWAKVHDHYYGSPAQFVEEITSRGEDVLLAIDPHGASSVKEKFSQMVSIFIVPPSWEELELRLRSRQLDDENSITKRLANARQEISNISQYDYVVVNAKFETALKDLESIIHAERLHVRKRDLLQQKEKVRPVEEPTHLSSTSSIDQENKSLTRKNKSVMTEREESN